MTMLRLVKDPQVVRRTRLGGDSVVHIFLNNLKAQAMESWCYRTVKKSKLCSESGQEVHLYPERLI